jgi:methionyl-tRNA formyltransferase
MKSEQFLYLGSPTVSADILKKLIDENLPITSVVSKEPKRRTRGSALSVTPVEKVAKYYNLNVFYNLDDIDLNNYSLGIVVAYGKLIPNRIISNLRLVNIHFSLLPKYRGAAPVERAILSGEHVTGVSLMEIAEDLDAGDIFDQIEVRIGETDTLNILYEKLATKSIDILVKNLKSDVTARTEPMTYSAANLGRPTRQTGMVTWAKKISTEELRISTYDTVKQAFAKIRIGGAYFYYTDLKVKVIEARILDSHEIIHNDELFDLKLSDNRLVLTLSDGFIELFKVIPQSKKEMFGSDFYNGFVKMKKIYKIDPYP